MGFPEQYPKLFVRSNVEALAPGQTGCYGLFSGNIWVYVGKGDIRSRLLAHLNGDNACIASYPLLHFVTWVTAQMDNVEKQLIWELAPTCNRRVG